MANLIYTYNLCGNVHDAARWINEQGYADYLFSIHPVGPGHHSTVCVFRMSEQMIRKIRTADPSYIGNHKVGQFEGATDDHEIDDDERTTRLW